mmetsp:Transcript_96413/g.244984  ORF Transcript_96413/g.244984 Transcript_96413/m.244984 type:complete len:206 (+) Transcript_96413:380-997(+)
MTGPARPPPQGCRAKQRVPHTRTPCRTGRGPAARRRCRQPQQRAAPKRPPNPCGRCTGHCRNPGEAPLLRLPEPSAALTLPPGWSGSAGRPAPTSPPEGDPASRLRALPAPPWRRRKLTSRSNVRLPLCERAPSHTRDLLPKPRRKAEWPPGIQSRPSTMRGSSGLPGQWPMLPASRHRDHPVAGSSRPATPLCNTWLHPHSGQP